MTTTPVTGADYRDQHIADLQAGLQLSIRLISYAAGQLASTAPDQADRLMAEVDRLMDLLRRTTPE